MPDNTPIVPENNPAAVADKIENMVRSGRAKRSHGYVGTDIFGGYLDVDYAQEWRDLRTRVPLIQKMVDGDAATSAVLEAIKMPLLSANYFIKEDKEIDDKLIDYANRLMFETQPRGFKELLSETLTFLEYGFCLFEKVAKIVNGEVLFDFEIRVQSSVDKWTIDGQQWINGHPPGVTQLLTGSDETMTTQTGPEFRAEIPWDKLLLFTFQRVGNNFEGKSILRRSNIHFKMKQMLYKVSIIAAERFGVGIPVAKHKTGVSPEFQDKLEDMLMNIRSNEQAYAMINEMVEELYILTPGSNSEKNSIADLIEHHDKKIYDSVLAGFLNLTNGEGGSNALSKDQSSFFLRGLQYVADYVCGIYDKCIKAGIDINFGPQEKYPELGSSDIGQISMDEYVNATATAKREGLVTWIPEVDETKAREQLKMPTVEPEVIKRQKEENMKQAQENMKQQEQNDTRRNENNNNNRNKEDNSFSEKKNLFFAQVTPRERQFIRNIGDYENYLESEYANYEKIFAVSEKRISDYLVKTYKKADTKRVDGVIVLDNTAKNTKLQQEMESFVDQEVKKLKEKTINSPLQDRLFDKTIKMAAKNLSDNEKFFQEEILVNQKRFNSFIKGYVSNVRGVLFNEPRRIKENIVLNFGSEASVDLVAKQAGEIKFNRNILKLSTITHARGAYNAILYDNNVDNGFVFFKVVIPKQKIKDLSPTGITSSLLFLILTAAEINRRASEKTDGKNSDAVAGLNLHHGAFAYYYPISSEDKKEEEAIAKEQREELDR